MKKITLIAGIASLGLAASALAGGQNTAVPVTNNSWYMGVNGGLFFPYISGLDTGYNLGAQLGYRMGNWRIEEAYNFYSNDSYDVPNLGHVYQSTLMTNGYYDFHNSSKFTPYVGIGIGWLHSWNNDAPDGDTWLVPKNTFAYQGILGLDYQLNRNMTVGVNYHYLKNEHSMLNATLNYYFN